MFPFLNDNSNSSFGDDPLGFVDSSGAPIPGGFFPGSPSGNMSISALSITDALSSDTFKWKRSNVTIRRILDFPGDDDDQCQGVSPEMFSGGMEEDQEAKPDDKQVESVADHNDPKDEKDDINVVEVGSADEASVMFERLSQTKYIFCPDLVNSSNAVSLQVMHFLIRFFFPCLIVNFVISTDESRITKTQRFSCKNHAKSHFHS